MVETGSFLFSAWEIPRLPAASYLREDDAALIHGIAVSLTVALRKAMITRQGCSYLRYHGSILLPSWARFALGLSLCFLFWPWDGAPCLHLSLQQKAEATSKRLVPMWGAGGCGVGKVKGRIWGSYGPRKLGKEGIAA